MRRKIYTDRFGKIDLKKMLNNIKSEDELFSNKILEYNYHNELLKSRLDEIQYLKEQIKENEKEVVKMSCVRKYIKRTFIKQTITICQLMYQNRIRN